MNEQQQIEHARQVAEKVRAVYLKAGEDPEIRERFDMDPLTLFAEHGLSIPAEYHDEFMASHRQSLAQNEGFWCRLCKSGLTFCLITVGVAVLAALAVAIATFFEVAVATAELVLDAFVAAYHGAISAHVLAAACCAEAKLNGPCAL